MNLNASANHCAVAPTKAPSATDSMSARVILHIGHPKMVSSVFQAFLAHNHHNLKAAGVLYPEHSSFVDALKNYISYGNLTLKTSDENWLEDRGLS